MPDNPWNGIQNLGAIDQKLYQTPKKEEEPNAAAPPSPAPEKRAKSHKPVVKPQKPNVVKVEVKPERKERQLNAWITSHQNDTLDRLYFRLRSQGVKLKKGELVGVSIEVLSRILDQYTPRTIDTSLLDSFLEKYEQKTKQKK
jgi:hypothetical protein